MKRRVLVTHPRDTWPALAARFADSEIEVHLIPTATQVDPLDPGPGDRALARLAGCAWLVVTSARGAEALVRRLRARGTEVPQSTRIAAVGPATASALGAAGLPAEVVSAESGASGLAAALGPRLGPGERVLLVRPEGAPVPEALTSIGADVVIAPLYRTVPSEEAARLAGAAIAGEFSAVVLTAPSSLDRWLDAAGERRAALLSALAEMTRIAIGPTTAAHLSASGLPAAAVAASPAEDAVGDAIAAALAR